jgi:hypothetical protein
MKRLSLGLLIGILSVGFHAGQAEDKGDDFGWWKESVAKCSLVRVSTPAGSRTSMDCISFRLDQQMRGLMSVRFESRKRENSHAMGKLVFAGVLESGSQPMRCQQGSCIPQLPMRFQVSAVAESDVDHLGLAAGLPRSYLAQGHCSVEMLRIRCMAKTLEGMEWNVDATR